jgi:hypothetical protein
MQVKLAGRTVIKSRQEGLTEGQAEKRGNRTCRKDRREGHKNRKGRTIVLTY